MTKPMSTFSLIGDASKKFRGNTGEGKRGGCVYWECLCPENWFMEIQGIGGDLGKACPGKLKPQGRTPDQRT